MQRKERRKNTIRRRKFVEEKIEIEKRRNAYMKKVNEEAR